MLTGSSAHPERALKLLHQLDLCKSVFLPPLEQSIFHGDGLPHDLDFQSEVWNHGYVYAAEMYQTLQERSDKPIDVNAMNDEQQNQFKLRILSSFLLPLRDHYVLVKKRQVFLPAFIIRESLKVRALPMCMINKGWLFFNINF
jgi:tRNA nucleotidyltransferase (CCA-adding enzyme)